LKTANVQPDIYSFSPLKKKDIWAILFLVALKGFILYCVLYMRGFTVFSSEGANRTLLSWWWANGMATVDGLGPLLPLHYYLVGYCSAFAGGPYAGAVLLSVTATVLLIPVFYAYTRLNGVSLFGAFAGGLFMCMIPWNSFVAISAHVQPFLVLLILSGLLCMTIWDRMEKPQPKRTGWKAIMLGYYEPGDLVVLLSGLLFMTAVATDLSAWAVLVLVTVFYFIRTLKLRMNPPTFAVWLLIAWYIPLRWCNRGVELYQDFFYVFRPGIPVAGTGLGKFLECIYTGVFSFIAVSPFIFVLLVVGIVLYRSFGKPILCVLTMLMMAFTASVMAVMGISNQKGILEAITPAVVLGCAVAGSIFSRLWFDKRWLAFLFLIAIVFQGALTTWRFPHVLNVARYDSAVKLGKLMNQSWKEDNYLRNTSLVIERLESDGAMLDARVAGIISGIPRKIFHDDIAVKFGWEGHSYLKSFSDNVRVPNIWCLGMPRRKSMFELSKRQCASYLKKMRTGVIAVSSRTFGGSIPDNYNLVGQLGRYVIYADKCADVKRLGERIKKISLDMRLFNKAVKGESFISSYRSAKGVITAGVYVEFAEGQVSQLGFQPGRSADVVIKEGRVVTPASLALEPRGKFEDTFVSLSLPWDMNGGQYDVSLVSGTKPERKLYLGPMVLAHSKSELIRAYMLQCAGAFKKNKALLKHKNLKSVPTSVFLRVLVSCWW